MQKPCIDTIFMPNVPLIVAVSGGVDSQVLLHIVLEKIPLHQIFVAHFNHGLRGDESDSDEIFVRDFCAKNGIQFFSEKSNISHLANIEKSSIEATARKYRYNFFEKISKQTGAKIILTAHHLDDRIETMFFNLIRGAKLSGITALKQYSERISEISGEKITIFRPFFTISKSEILRFAQEKNIAFRTDSSNQNSDYQRNLLRNAILPEFEKINPNYRVAIGNFLNFSEDLLQQEKIKTKNWLRDQTEKNNKTNPKFRNISGVFLISEFSKLSI